MPYRKTHQNFSPVLRVNNQNEIAEFMKKTSQRLRIYSDEMAEQGKIGLAGQRSLASRNEQPNMKSK